MDILIVEDNKEISDLLTELLRTENYTVSATDNGKTALHLYEKYGVRLVLLDIMLSDKTDGFEITRKIREANNTPIIIISAKSEKNDKLQGLLLGADDYIEKPFDIDILLAKIAGIFKRRYSDIVTDGFIKINRTDRTALIGEKPIELNIKEFDLMLYFVENKGRVLKKEEIFNAVWGIDSFSEPQTLTVHINRLREKIETDSKNPEHIITVWGVGYKYK